MAPLLLLTAATLIPLLSSCSEKRVVPTPTTTPAPRPTPLPPPPQASTRDWRQAPISPGEWSWGVEAGQSVARFAGGTLVLRCDRAAGMVTLARLGGSVPVPLTVTTTAGVRTVAAAPQAGALVASLSASDTLLDAITFSRGRFVVEAPGVPPLYVPSWPEVGRVAEDCR